ncbi:Uncharacterised protein [Staphylococcus intermedius NCTC 11048]|uniref:Uncharacterized protein n=1 Tax=Staphylococcus intermedius NCTC 11048 TaxID=1141106 RepID=A0A380G2V2_STAIN|nr:Uncharacterised protein [Staphylococcus intermedius NCTC 11048]
MKEKNVKKFPDAIVIIFTMSIIAVLINYGT